MRLLFCIQVLGVCLLSPTGSTAFSFDGVGEEIVTLMSGESLSFELVEQENDRYYTWDHCHEVLPRYVETCVDMVQVLSELATDQDFYELRAGDQLLLPIRQPRNSEGAFVAFFSAWERGARPTPQSVLALDSLVERVGALEKALISLEASDLQQDVEIAALKAMQATQEEALAALDAALASIPLGDFATAEALLVTETRLRAEISAARAGESLTVAEVEARITAALSSYVSAEEFVLLERNVGDTLRRLDSVEDDTSRLITEVATLVGQISGQDGLEARLRVLETRPAADRQANEVTVPEVERSTVTTLLPAGLTNAEETWWQKWLLWGGVVFAVLLALVALIRPWRHGSLITVALKVAREADRKAEVAIDTATAAEGLIIGSLDPGEDALSLIGNWLTQKHIDDMKDGDRLPVGWKRDDGTQYQVVFVKRQTVDHLDGRPGLQVDGITGQTKPILARRANVLKTLAKAIKDGTLLPVDRRSGLPQPLAA